MASRGLTKEACHGCGKQDIGPIISYRPDGEKGPRPFRGTTEVCSACKQLMKDGQRWRAHVSKSAKSAEAIKVISTTADHGWRGYYEGEPEPAFDRSDLLEAYVSRIGNQRVNGHGLRDELRGAMWTLAGAVSEEVQAEYYDNEDGVPRMFTVCGDYGFRSVSIIHPFLHRLINDIDMLIRLMLHWSYWNGVRYGRNLLRQLNDGELAPSGMDEVNEQESRELESLHERLRIVVRARPEKKRKRRA